MVRRTIPIASAVAAVLLARTLLAQPPKVTRAGGIDLGVIDVMAEPWPDSFDVSVIAKGARDARGHYKNMFRDVDAAIMMPGATTSHPAYLAMQDLLKDDLTEHR